MTRRQTPLHAARRQAAKELDLPADDWRVVRLSTLVVAHEVLQAKLATGAMIDVGYLLQLDNAIAEVRATSAPAPTLQLRYCRKLHGVCQKCGHIQELDEDVPSPGPSPNSPPARPSAAANGSAPAFNPPIRRNLPRRLLTTSCRSIRSVRTRREMFTAAAGLHPRATAACRSG